MHSPIREMIYISKAYCDEVESADDADNEWLLRIALLLPRLHAAIVALGASSTISEHQLIGNPEHRFELYVRLQSVIGARDRYWLEFDPSTDVTAMSGSLADDLTDIYFELKQVLQQLEPYRASLRKAVTNWRIGYEIHWGQHLLDAERHLYALSTKNRLH